MGEHLYRMCCKLGFPTEILSDDGPQFVSELYKTMWELLGTKPRHATPYHPQANLTERVNRILITMLKIYAQRHQTSWDVRLPELEFAINTATSESTGLAPCEIMFGRMLQGPSTLRPLEEPSDKEIIQFAKFLRQRLEGAIEFVKENLIQAKERQKEYYDRKHRPSPFKLGDLVWRDLHLQSDAIKQFTTKLSPRRDGPYEIVKMISENVVILWDPKTEKEFGPVNVAHLTHYVTPVIPNLVIPEPIKLDKNRPNRGDTNYNLRHKPKPNTK